MAYIKKEVIYDAVSFEDLAKGERCLMSLKGFYYENIYIEKLSKEQFAVNTPLGYLIFNEGEYLIIGDDNSINVINKATFENCYRKID